MVVVASGGNIECVDPIDPVDGFELQDVVERSKARSPVYKRCFNSKLIIIGIYDRHLCREN